MNAFNFNFTFKLTSVNYEKWIVKPKEKKKNKVEFQNYLFTAKFV